MKKFIALSAMMALLASACSKPDDTPPVEAGNISFEITASTLTRTSPFYSQETSLLVTNVNVYAFLNDGDDNYLYAQTFTIPNWDAGLDFARYTIPTGEKLPVGTYKFLAVGRNSASDGYALTTPLTVGTTRYEEMAATVSAPGLEGDIYAGNEESVVTTEGTRVVITMTRKVAGILAYFKNVPQEIGETTVRYLRLTMSTAQRTVNLSTGLGSNVAASLPYNVIDIDLEGQSVDNGVYEGVAIANIQKLPFTQLAGTFVIPVTGATFTLGLYDEGDVALKTWNVQLSSVSPISLVANNLYSLGKKVKAGSTNGGTPTDPSDDDAPVDLMVDQSMALTISPNWDAVKYLTIQ